MLRSENVRRQSRRAAVLALTIAGLFKLGAAQAAAQGPPSDLPDSRITVTRSPSAPSG